MQRSGLQTDVLVLYRNLLRTARKKRDPSGELYQIVREKFRERATSINKYEFQVIEHELRYGYKMSKLIAMPGFSTASMIKR